MVNVGITIAETMIVEMASVEMLALQQVVRCRTVDPLQVVDPRPVEVHLSLDETLVNKRESLVTSALSATRAQEKSRDATKNGMLAEMIAEMTVAMIVARRKGKSAVTGNPDLRSNNDETMYAVDRVLEMNGL
jgi:hypothetical protein